MSEHFQVNDTLTSLKETLRSKHLSAIEEAVDAVVALLLHPNASDLDLLLIHRAERAGDPWSGQIGLPGGRVAQSDLTSRDALRREVVEEIGVDLNEESEELGTLSIGSPMRRLDMRVQPWVYKLPKRPTIVAGPEVQDAFWVSVFKLPSFKTSTEVEVRGIRREVEAFLVDGRVVWGYTHRVLNELLSVLNPDI